MKVNERRHTRMNARTSAIVSLCVVMVITLILGILGTNGMWLDSRGLYKLLPWLPATSTDNWTGSIPLGLDLKGGIFIEYALVTEEDARLEEPELDAILDTSIAMIRNRLAEMEYTEARVSKLGTTGIRVELAGTADLSMVLEMISSQGKLEFIDSQGVVFLNNDHLESAGVGFNQQNTPMLGFSFTGEGVRIFAERAAREGEETFTINLNDSELMGTPSAIADVYDMMGGDNSLSLTVGSQEHAVVVAVQLRNGPLPLALKQGKIDIVPATLGEGALGTMVIAGIIGLLLVMLMLILRYRLMGVIAVWTLVINIILLFLFTAATPGMRLSFGGVVGLVLGITISMITLIVVFERLREEILQGRPLAHAVRLGFENAKSTARDLNFIIIVVATGVLLLDIGSSQNFATTLLLGGVTSLISAVAMPRYLLTRVVRLTSSAALFVREADIQKNAETANGEAE